MRDTLIALGPGDPVEMNREDGTEDVPSTRVRFRGIEYDVPAPEGDSADCWVPGDLLAAIGDDEETLRELAALCR